jgi:ankyrin repeat protein
MHLAAQSDSVYSIAYFSMRHKESMNERDNDGQTPLHWAAMNGSINVISYIIGLSERDQWSSIVNAQDNDGRTPLHLAIINVQKFENLQPHKELFTKGARLDVKDNQGFSPMDLIASLSDLDMRD